jgi:cellulose synthase/poly-beta-1,6-N-acetylglucosamine synthase-like glycosyltransferase
MVKNLLIVPCFNEQERLDFDQFNLFKDQIDFFFVDDGSTDLTYQKIIENNFSALKLEKTWEKDTLFMRPIAI